LAGDVADRPLFPIGLAQLGCGWTLYGLRPIGGTPTIELVILHRPFYLASGDALIVGDAIHRPKPLVELSQALS
jgi:hypothetical protein